VEGPAHDDFDYEVKAHKLSPEDLVEKWKNLPKEQNESKTKASTENVQIVDKVKPLKP
jgi:ribosomal protein L29